VRNVFTRGRADAMEKNGERFEINQVGGGERGTSVARKDHSQNTAGGNNSGGGERTVINKSLEPVSSLPGEKPNRTHYCVDQRCEKKGTKKGGPQFGSWLFRMRKSLKVIRRICGSLHSENPYESKNVYEAITCAK